MTNEQKFHDLLCIAIEYISNIADEDSPTFRYLITEYDKICYPENTSSAQPKLYATLN